MFVQSSLEDLDKVFHDIKLHIVITKSVCLLLNYELNFSLFIFPFKSVTIVFHLFVVNFIKEEIKLGDWVAVDYDTGTLYIGRVTNMTTGTGEASFTYKMMETDIK